MCLNGLAEWFAVQPSRSITRFATPWESAHGIVLAWLVDGWRWVILKRTTWRWKKKKKVKQALPVSLGDHYIFRIFILSLTFKQYLHQNYLGGISALHVYWMVLMVTVNWSRWVDGVMYILQRCSASSESLYVDPLVFFWWQKYIKKGCKADGDVMSVCSHLSRKVGQQPCLGWMSNVRALGFWFLIMFCE